jgi:hypothetical protein
MVCCATHTCSLALLAHFSRVEKQFPGTAAAAAEKARLAAQPKMKISYFDVAAAPGEKLRLALSLAVGPNGFEDDRIKSADWPERKTETRFGKVPMLTVDGEKYFQSPALLRYIGSTAGDGSL